MKTVKSLFRPCFRLLVLETASFDSGTGSRLPPFRAVGKSEKVAGRHLYSVETIVVYYAI